MKKKIVFFTGAGVSQESGVPTFRDQDGLWYNHKVEDVATVSGWKKNKEMVLNFYNELRRKLLTIQPNDAHKIIGNLEQDYDVVVVTQNVDSLHELGGSTNVIHLHGELFKSRSTLDENLIYSTTEDIKLGDKCEKGSQLRPHIVWFGERTHNLDIALKEVESADILVIVGTSLNVYPAAGLITHVKSNCKTFYIDPKPSLINGDVTCIPHVATKGMKLFKETLVK